MKLSYSDYKTYINCPRLYYNRTNKIEPPERSSKYFSLYGKLIEKFFEKYTNDFSRNKEPLKDSQIRFFLRDMWNNILEYNYVNWSEPWVKETSDEIFDSVYNDVKANLDIFDFWKYSRSEVTLEVLLKKNKDILKGRVDFICKRPDGVVEIIDGKGTRKVDKTVDIEQLYFYALLYMLKNKRLPDKLGFLYYKFHMIKYIDFDMDSIMEFKDKLALVKKAIKADEKFECKVGISKQCKWCEYQLECPGFINKKKMLAEKRAAKSKIHIPDSNGEVISFSA